MCSGGSGNGGHYHCSIWIFLSVLHFTSIQSPHLWSLTFFSCTHNLMLSSVFLLCKAILYFLRYFRQPGPCFRSALANISHSTFCSNAQQDWRPSAPRTGRISHMLCFKDRTPWRIYHGCPQIGWLLSKWRELFFWNSRRHNCSTSLCFFSLGPCSKPFQKRSLTTNHTEELPDH